MKYRFEITYQPVYFKKASEMMRKMDLDIGEVGLQYVITFNTDDQDIKNVKSNLIAAFNSQELTILNIEGGKVE